MFSSFSDSIIRIVTLNLAIELLIKLVYNVETKISFLSAEHFSRLERTFDELRENLRRSYQIEELFLDLFENEYRTMCQHPIRLEQTLRDASLLCPMPITSLTGVERTRRVRQRNFTSK